MGNIATGTTGPLCVLCSDSEMAPGPVCCTRCHGHGSFVPTYVYVCLMCRIRALVNVETARPSVQEYIHGGASIWENNDNHSKVTHIRCFAFSGAAKETFMIPDARNSPGCVVAISSCIGVYKIVLRKT